MWTETLKSRQHKGIGTKSSIQDPQVVLRQKGPELRGNMNELMNTNIDMCMYVTYEYEYIQS